MKCYFYIVKFIIIYYLNNKYLLVVLVNLISKVKLTLETKMYELIVEFKKM